MLGQSPTSDHFWYQKTCTCGPVSVHAYYFFGKANAGLRNKVTYNLVSFCSNWICRSSTVSATSHYFIVDPSLIYKLQQHLRAWWGCRTRLVWSEQRQRAREGEYFPKHFSSPIILFDTTLSAAIVTEHKANCQSGSPPPHPWHRKAPRGQWEMLAKTTNYS